MRTTVGSRSEWAQWWRAAGALVLVTVLMVGCGGEGGGTQKVTNPRDPVRVMLRERAVRLNAGDLEGWLASVAPEARPHEEQVGKGALAVPLARVDLTLGAAEVDPTGTRFKDAEIQLIYRYKDLPTDNVFRFHLVYDLELREGKWVVTSSVPSTAMDIPPPPIWATGPVEVASSPHFLALFRPGLGNADEVLAKGEEGRVQLLPRLTLTPDERHLALLARNEKDYTDFTGIEGGGSVAAVYTSLRTPTGGRSAIATRPENRMMAINVDAVTDPRQLPVEFEGQPGVFPRVVFQHELGHLALSRFDRAQTPVWVSEAGAMRLADERRIDAWKEIVQKDLFEKAGLDFDGMSRQDQISGIQYAYANAGAFYLIESAGIEKFWDFYQNFKALGATMTDLPEVRARGAQRLVRRYYGYDLDELDNRTRDYMRKAVAAGG